MEERINKRLFFIGILSLVLTAIMTTIVFQSTFDTQVKNDLRRDAEMISTVYETSGEYIDVMSKDGVRITHINSVGSVLFESMTSIDQMENHIARPEVQTAISSGIGEATRKSSTLGYNTYYYAKLLNDGTVMRVSMDVVSMYASFDQMILIVIVLAFLILIISVVLSVFLTKQLIKPIEDMVKNLEDIEANVPYPELEPFAGKIKEQQLRKRENERMRREFTANVSHELKTPLTSISGYAEMVENGMAKQEDVQGFAQKIHNEAGRLISVIGDIIKLSEIEEPTVESFEKVNLAEVAEETVDAISFAAELSEVTIAFDGGDCFVAGNRDMLGELMYNLCDNAIRYNLPKGSVLVSTDTDNEVVVLRVADTGIGIPKGHHSRVFERFYRVDKSRSKQTGGTGLGLAIVKHIALKHGASINIDSDEGDGTRITVTFRSYKGE